MHETKYENWPTKYWHRLDDGRVQCDLCPRHCKMHEDQRGLCYVRGVHEGEVVLHSYGRSSGFCIDPIEKKPLKHFYPGSAVLSLGTAGCNLACKFCQNWDISKSREMDTLAGEASPEALAAAAEQHGCRSIAYTYNDPIIFHEYAIDCAQAAHELDIKAVAVSAGYVSPEPRAEFYQHMDAANIDLKAFTEEFYKKLCGGELEAVKDTLRYIKHETKVWLELTTLIIPGHNDSEAELHALCDWVMKDLGPDVPIHFTAFHPDWKMRDVPPTPVMILLQAQKIAKQHGIHYAYVGNVQTSDGANTHCPNCNSIVIGRSNYSITSWNITSDGTDNGSCRECHQPIAGCFEDAHENWGSRRQPVRIIG